MPRGDGTGPTGMGLMTARATGYCVGHATSGVANPTGGRGFGMGTWGRSRGGGRRWRHWFYASGQPEPMHAGACARDVAPEQELEALKQQAASLQNTLSQINERIEQLQA